MRQATFRGLFEVRVRVVCHWLCQCLDWWLLGLQSTGIASGTRRIRCNGVRVPRSFRLQSLLGLASNVVVIQLILLGL